MSMRRGRGRGALLALELVAIEDAAGLEGREFFEREVEQFGQVFGGPAGEGWFGRGHGVGRNC